MSAHDESKYSWLKAEKDLIGQAIATGKPILGVCLGSQLIADVLGSKVYKNPEPEIGWFPIELSEKAKSHELGRLIPPQVEVFHWHGETFDLCPKELFIWQAVKPVRTKPLSMATESWGFNFILRPPKRLLRPSFTDVLMNSRTDHSFRVPARCCLLLIALLGSIKFSIRFSRNCRQGWPDRRTRGRPARHGGHDGRAHSPGGPAGLVRGPIPSRSLFWGCFRGLAAFFH